MGKPKADTTLYDADQVIDTDVPKKSPEELQKERLVKISKEVLKAANLLKKISSYSHPKYKLTQAQVTKIHTEIDKAYTVFNTSLVVSEEQASIFDSL